MVCDSMEETEPRRGPGDTAVVLLELGEGALPWPAGGGGEDESNEKVDVIPLDVFSNFSHPA